MPFLSASPWMGSSFRAELTQFFTRPPTTSIQWAGPLMQTLRPSVEEVNVGKLD